MRKADLPVSLSERKKALRKTYSALRRTYYPKAPVPWNSAPEDWSFLPEDRHPTALLLFSPLPGEPDTAPLAQLAMRDGVPLYYPRVVGSEMVFHRVPSPQHLSPGAFGIGEPDAGAPVYIPGEYDVCIVPGVAFDRNGYRLGRGGGYYDRFLPGFPGVSVGLCPAPFLADEIPTEEHDRSVSFLMVWDPPVFPQEQEKRRG